MAQTRYKILRNIPEVFEVVAETYEEAIEMIADGNAGDSVPLMDQYELVSEEAADVQD